MRSSPRRTCVFWHMTPCRGHALALLDTAFSVAMPYLQCMWLLADIKDYGCKIVQIGLGCRRAWVRTSKSCTSAR